MNVFTKTKTRRDICVFLVWVLNAGIVPVLHDTFYGWASLISLAVGVTALALFINLTDPWSKYGDLVGMMLNRAREDGLESSITVSPGGIKEERA